MRKRAESITGEDVPRAAKVVRRTVEISLEAWTKIVLDDGVYYLRPHKLEKLYAEGWDAAALREVLAEFDAYDSRPRYVRKQLKMLDIEQRMALAVWRECAKLMTRQMTGDAKKMLLAVKLRAEQTLRLPGSGVG